MSFKNFLLLGLLGTIVSAQTGWPQDTSRTELLRVGLKSTPRGFRQDKLSPELRAARVVGGELVGRTRDGEAIIRADRQQAAARLVASNAFKSLSVDVPADVQPIDVLFVKYESAEAGDKATLRRALERAGFQVTEDYQKGNFFVVNPRRGITAAMIDTLEQTEGIGYAWPNYRVGIIPPPRMHRNFVPPGPQPESERQRDVNDSALVVPDDEHWPWLWGLRDMNAHRAWRHVTGSRNVIVAVIDTGVDSDHPDLQDNIWTNPLEIEDGMDNDGNGIVDDIHGANFVDWENPSGDSEDAEGHGTHCAGTIAAFGNNQEGVVGVNWQVQIMPIKFLGESGGTIMGAVKSIDYALDKGAHVLSNSWGGGSAHPALEEAIERARDLGVLFVAAAGNSFENTDETPNYPSSYETENIISVAAIDPRGPLAEFSNYGAKSVDIAAPGVAIRSTVPPDADPPFPSPYADLDGTSMAAPHVAGAVALLYSDPRYGGHDGAWLTIRNAILENARTLPWLQDKCTTGGTLDVGFLAASDAVAARAGETVTVPNVVGKSIAFATLQLRGMGLQAQQRQLLDATAASEDDSKRVAKQIPEAGTAVTKGAIVTLLVR